jgi:hypothetical protein
MFIVFCCFYRSQKYILNLTTWPGWVLELYNPEILVQRVHKQMQKLKLFSQAEVSCIKDWMLGTNAEKGGLGLYLITNYMPMD